MAGTKPIVCSLNFNLILLHEFEVTHTFFRQMDVTSHPNHDYLADIQDILLKMDGEYHY